MNDKVYIEIDGQRYEVDDEFDFNVSGNNLHITWSDVGVNLHVNKVETK